MARKLKARLADSIAAANVTELQAGRPHPLKGDRAIRSDEAESRRTICSGSGASTAFSI
ncbi:MULTISPECIES: hypothetical protein [Planktothricoides]|uniref:Uncharacterized protein n=2 Tax=Planktothricoides raciborskii TaxID=132608 RepID=A0AAU8JC67_9CYAN|nr:MULTISPECIES: hypothetical protein [Planktothricoides]MBD2542879.1 hypothetical protein [Planktothricoides raciborskii FACHB-1370]MBD2581374.1 hypothetical protein [Planktothricoides raciborskii FACHB-1261]